MNKHAKLITLLCMVMCAVLVFWGCNKAVGPAETEPGKPTMSDGSSDDSLDLPDKIHLVECQFYGDSMYNLNYKEAWPLALEEKYGISVTMSYPLRDKYMETLYESAVSGELTGIVEIFGGAYLLQWIGNEWIYPLSDYLADNEVWNNMIPQMWKDAYTYNDHVWALASGSDGEATWFARAMRGDWLDTFGLDKPYTIDEFYEASYKFTYNDPDGNDVDDTTGFTSAGIWNLQDIFQSFDARLNHVAEPVPVWNPNENIWEDSMIKPEMNECMTFLKMVYDEKVMDNDIFAATDGAIMRQKVSQGRCGGTFYWDSWVWNFSNMVTYYVGSEAYMVCVGGLSGNIEKKLNHYNVGIGSPKVMMKNTEQPKETINWYVNTFFGDEWGFWTGRFGPVGEERGEAGKSCTIEDKTIIRNTYIDSSGNIRVYPSPGFIGGLPSRALYSVYELKYYAPSNPEWAEKSAQTAYDKYTTRKEWIEEYIANGMAYLLPDKLTQPTSEKYLEIYDEIHSAAMEAITASVTGSAGIEDSLNNYRRLAKVLGVKDILDFENAKLGKATAQEY